MNEIHRKGSIAYDREQDSEVVILRLNSDRCDEVVCEEDSIFGERTVYSYNKRYGYVDPSEPVVVAKYVDDVQQVMNRAKNKRDVEKDLTRKGRFLLASECEKKEYYFPISRIVEKRN